MLAWPQRLRLNTAVGLNSALATETELKRTTALLTTAMALLLLPFAANADWFDEIRDGDDKEALYRTLYYMPKGGDLHNHLSGAVFAEWWYELALAQQARGYEYYTKVRIDNCRDFGGNAFARDPYFLLFRRV